MSTVELKLSEVFHRHKRNLLLLCSAIIVLGLAAPIEVKVPFLGTDVTILARHAFAVLLAALIYAALSFSIEARVIATRNSEMGAVAGTDLDTAFAAAKAALTANKTRLAELDTQLAQTLGRVQDSGAQLANQPQVLAMDIANKLDQFVRPTRPGTIGAGDAPPLSETINLLLPIITSRVSEAGSEMRELSDRYTAEVDNRSAQIAEIQQSMDAIISDYADLRGRFQRLSRSIHAAQRIGFTWLELIVPSTMTVAATLVCLSEIFRGQL